MKKAFYARNEFFPPSFVFYFFLGGGPQAQGKLVGGRSNRTEPKLGGGGDLSMRRILYDSGDGAMLESTSNPKKKDLLILMPGAGHN